MEPQLLANIFTKGGPAGDKWLIHDTKSHKDNQLTDYVVMGFDCNLEHISQFIMLSNANQQPLCLTHLSLDKMISVSEIFC